MMDFESKKIILQVDLLDKIYSHSKFVRFVFCSLLWVWIQNKYTRKESGEILGFLLSLSCERIHFCIFFISGNESKESESLLFS